MIRRLVSYLRTLTLYPAARAIVTFQSERQRWNTMGQKPKVHFETPHAGQRIMLLALYEKGQLRPDVVRLIEAARAEGLYVLAVNTLKLQDPAALQGLIDCYIERANFGRDFGSYQTGFMHVFNNNWHETCPRLLMINDSIFFSEERMPKFLNDMMTSDVEVLGSTENYEIEYHLGSFCIAMAQSALQKPVFQKYWRGYRLTDVRPTVIKRGEMKLSKTLKKCVSEPRQFRSLYSSAFFLKQLNNDPSLMNFVMKNSRTSNLVDWDRFSATEVVTLISERFIVPKNTLPDSTKLDLKINADLSEIGEETFIHDLDSLKNYVVRNVDNFDDVDPSLVDDTLVSFMTQLFMNGSQIHQNAATLVSLGLPIIKLDGMYRGMFNVFDVQRISRLLDSSEAAELQQILMERPFAGNTFIGWRRAAFMSGLI